MKTVHKTVWVLTAAIWAFGQWACSASAPVQRFDFGSARGAWPGFVGVDEKLEYAPEAGYGWTRHTGRFKKTQRARPEKLSADFMAPRDADFRVDLPNGRYRVWIRRGDSQVTGVYQIYRGQVLALNGRRVFEENPSAREIFEERMMRHYRDVWTPDLDLYETFIEENFDEQTFDVTVTQGLLNVHIENVPLTAMIVYPAAAESQMRAELARLHAGWRAATVLRDIGKQKGEPSAFTANPAERARGYVVFERMMGRRPYPSTVPQPEERVEALRAFGARGEWEPVCFAIYPLRALRQVRVSVGPLRAASGSVLPASAVDVRFNRYMAHQKQKRGWVSEYEYDVRADILDRTDALDIPAGVTYKYWLRIHVPANQAAGVYKGAVRIQEGANGPAMRVPLTFEVFPFELPPARIPFGMYYGISPAWYTRYWGSNVFGPSLADDPEMDRITWATERAHLRFMKTLGFRTVAFCADQRKDLAFQGTRPVIKPDNRFVRWMDLYTQMGMDVMPYYGFVRMGERPHALRSLYGARFERPAPEWNEAYRNIILAFAAEGRKRGWPEILWYISDELSNTKEEGAQIGLELATLTKDLPGIRTFASMNGQYECIMLPHIDIATPNYGFPINEETLKKIHDSGATLWLYNVGENRFSFGLYPWALRAHGRLQWHYGSVYADDWDTLDNGGRYGIQRLGPGYEVFPHHRAEQEREGIDDYRYLQLLETRLEQARGKSRAKAEARAFLDGLRAQIPADVRKMWKVQLDPKDVGGVVTGRLSSDKTMNSIRRTAAGYILALQ